MGRLRRPPVPPRVGPAIRLHLPRDPLRRAGLPRPGPCRPASPLFATPSFGRPPRDSTTSTPVVPEEPIVADVRQLDPAPGRSRRTRVAGIFLFLPSLARL